jgi:hypothetical protein
MKTAFKLALALALTLVRTSGSFAQDQTVPGQGNAAAVALSQRSPIVQSALRFLVNQADTINDRKLRKETQDAITNVGTCIQHRSGLTETKKNAILQTLIAQGLVDLHDDATFPGGLKAGVFPPVLDESGACAHLPQTFFPAPGSVFGGHHSYPGGLPVHESNNDISDVNLAHQYRAVYGNGKKNSFPTIDLTVFDKSAEKTTGADIFIDEDVIIGAPIWHDWAKAIVFQWNRDGSEFQELNFGGNGTTDAFGAAGNSKTGGHHIMSVAEAMKRGLSPAFVITQACAHSAPTSGNEYKVVNWLRAAAIMAQIDPVANGYLTIDGQGQLRLPALRRTGDLNLLSIDPTQTNLLAEYTLHNLSDADFTYSGPAVAEVKIVLQNLAPTFGYNPADVSVYNNKFRNPVLSSLTAERLLILYSQKGVAGVQAEIAKLRGQGII